MSEPGPAFVVIPVTPGLPATSAAAVETAGAQDLAGSAPLTVLIVDQQIDPPTATALGAVRRSWLGDRVQFRTWHHHPPLPSLAATWNRALDYVWRSGGEDALVLNNDVELPPTYYRLLRQRLRRDDLLFLSGVGVRTPSAPQTDEAILAAPMQLHPDYSAFLIARECHRRYPFDEGFVPAFCEDLDHHRRMLLGDDGRKIGKINLPFLHHASSTIRAMDGEARQDLNRRVDAGARAHYRRKWGRENQETRREPFGEDVTVDVTMDRLRKMAEEGKSVREDLGLREDVWPG